MTAGLTPMLSLGAAKLAKLTQSSGEYYHTLYSPEVTKAKTITQLYEQQTLLSFQNKQILL